MENAITYQDKIKLIEFILCSDKFTNGEKVKQLENEWNKWLGSEYSLFVSSGSTANFLLIASIKELYNLKSGDKVLVPACTWTTNVSPIIQLGLTPIFCDIQFSDFSFDHSNLEYISKQHPDIKLIFVTHLLGFTSKARSSGILQELFPNALIIDDVCESHGCTYDSGNKIGYNSLGATFSTYFGHHMNSIEGGFISTNNVELYDLMKMKRSHGMARESSKFELWSELYPNIDKQFLFITDGYNFRNTELNAVLGLSQLKQLDKSIKIRNDNYKEYYNVIKNYTCWFYDIASYIEKTKSNFAFPLISYRKEVIDEVKKLLSEHNIEYRPIVSGNLLKHPFLNDYSVCSNKKVLNVDIIHDNGIYLGNNQFVNKQHFDLLSKILQELIWKI